MDDTASSTASTTSNPNVILSLDNRGTHTSSQKMCEMGNSIHPQQIVANHHNNTGSADRSNIEGRVTSSTISSSRTVLSSKSLVSGIRANVYRLDNTGNSTEIMRSRGENVDTLSCNSTQRLDRLSLRDEHDAEQKSQERGEECTAMLAYDHLPQDLSQLQPPPPLHPPVAAEVPSRPAEIAAIRIPIYKHHQHHHQQQQQRPVSPAVSIGASSHCSTTSSTSFSNPRKRFLLFVKILFKCLDQANEPEVLRKAKKIIAECTRRNRLGDTQFTPLMEAVEKRLRGFVGEVHWRRSVLLLRHYLLKQKNNTI